LGIKISKITPRFDKRYKLELEKENIKGNKAVCKINERQAPVGRRVYEKLGKIYKESGIIIEHIRGGNWESERRSDCPSFLLLSMGK